MADAVFSGSLKPGVKLGKYEVREQVAAGGMAVIYKAYDPSLDRHVAIKQIAPHLAQDERFVEKFRSEAQTLARLSGSQANIVNVHELIEADGHQLYLVMEYVEGTTLRTIMDRGPVPLQTGLGVLLSTALGLRAMHAQGIVHRDLTPMNIMMARDGALKITDFGLIGHSGGRTSLPMGTTKYMAPEMFTGAPVDPRADLYSLGLIAYEMFAGPEKFAQVFKDVLRDERAQQVRWMHWHANANSRAPSLKEVQPGVPPLISKIVDRMMEKDPSKRFASAEQIIRWLRRIFVMHVQGKSVSLTDSETLEKEIEAEASAPTVPAVRTPGKGPAGRGGAGVPAVVEKTAPIPQPKLTWKKAAVYGAVIGGPLVLLAVGLLIWNHYRLAGIQERARSAIQEADVLYEEERFGEAAAAFDKITREFEDLKSYAVYAHLKSLMARAENALAKKDWDEADRAWDEAAKNGAASNWSRGFQERLAAARNVEQRVAEAKRAEQDQKYEEAIALLDQLRASYPDADKCAGVNLAEWITDLQYKQVNREYQQKMLDGKTALEKGLLDEAVRLFQEARKVRETPEVVELIQTVTNRKEFTRLEVLGDRYAADRKWPEAVDAYGKALKIQPSEAVKKKMDNAKAESLAVDARALMAAGVPSEAIKKWSEVLQYNPQHPEALREIRKYAGREQLEGLIRAGDQAMAQKQWEPAVRSFEAALKLLDPGDAEAKRIQGQIAEARYEAFMESGRDAMARRAWEEARSKLNQAKALKDSPEVNDLLARLTDDEANYKGLDLGKELMAQGKIVDAIKVFKDALKKRDTQEVRNLINEGYYGMYLAQARYYLGRNEPATANGYLKLARDYANDEKKKIEVQALQQEANRLIQEQAAPEGKG